MTPHELKNSILQLAIQGKLVEQRADEGTGAELLEKIFAAKNAEDAKKNLTRSRGVRGGGETEVLNVANVQQLPISNTSFQLGNEERGMRKLGIGNNGNGNISTLATLKNLSASPREEISDDEKPFDIPESWEWVRLGDCTSYAAKKEKVLSTDIRPDEWSLDLEDIEKDTGRIIEFRSAKDRRIVGEKVVFHKGQILYSKLRPYLKKILVAPNDGICTPELVPFSVLGGIDARYLVVVLKSPHVDFLINSVTYGVKMPRVGTETMINLLIPLPPLAEQKRIVAKIEELMPLVDRYEKAWSKLKDFNKRFPVDIKKSLLQMAIQGKLVDQCPEEGTAAELLEKIFAAKDAKKNLTRSRGVRGGCEEGELFNLPKVVKSHPEKFSALSASPREEIPDDEKPFDIPESWEWVRLESIVNSVPSKQYQILESEVRTSGKFAVISQSKEYSIGFTDISEKVYHHVNPVIVFGDHTTEVKYVEFDFVVGADGVKIFEPLDGLLLAKYLFYVLLFNTYDLSKVGGYSRHYKFLKNKPIPLPPLAEQKRIVAKLEELLPLCERLKAKSGELSQPELSKRSEV